MKYQVFQDGLAADITGYPSMRKDMGWDISVFDTFDEALDYANLWAYPIEKKDLSKHNRRLIPVNTPTDCSICEIPVMMEIRSI